MAEETCAPDDLIQEGDNVVLSVNGEKYSFIKVTSSGTVRVGKSNCSMKPIIGVPFGTAFLMNERGVLLPTDEIITEGMETATTTERSNAELVGGANQQLSQADIDEMRRQKRGDEIVEALAAASNTFASKTEFSQEKWRKKKTKKYLFYATALRPTARIICEAYFSKAPAKIFNLRPDSLAIMLSLANVGSFGQVLCVDATGGVVAAACVERLGGHGTLCCAHAEERMYSLDVVRQLNAKRALARSTRHCLLSSLMSAHVAVTQAAAASGEVADEDAQKSSEQTPQDQPRDVPQSADVELPADPGATAEEATAASLDASAQADGEVPHNDADQVRADGDEAQPGDANSQDNPKLAAKQANAWVNLHDEPTGNLPNRMLPATEQDVSTLVQQGFSSFISVAPRLDAAELLATVLPLLRPSAAFAVFSSSLQHLVEAFSTLQTSRDFVSLQLQESWWREQQVLPSRTHPTMSTPGTGGYILSGIRVVPAEMAQDRNVTGQKRRQDNGNMGRPQKRHQQ